MAANPETPVKVKSRIKKEDICRLCGKEQDSNYLVKIFSNTGLKKKISQQINAILQIKVEEHDHLSQRICKSCENFLLKVWKYLKQVKETQHELQKTLLIKRGIISSPAVKQANKRLKRSPVSRKSLTYNSIEDTFNIEEPNLSTNFSILSELNVSCQKLCSRKTPSILYNKNFDDMKNFQTDALWEEMKSHPFLIGVMKAVCGETEDVKEGTKLKFLFIYSILMQQRWHELSLFQRINTVQLIKGKCSKEFQKILNKLGVCLCHPIKGKLLDLIGGHFCDKAVEIVRNNGRLRGTSDNWDLKVLVATRKLKNNVDFHMMASNLIENRVTSSHLPNDTPIHDDIRQLNRNAFSMTAQDWNTYKSTASILIGRILVAYLPKFLFLKSILPSHIPHEYSKETSKKSTIISMPILDVNEIEYAECVKALRQFELWNAEIHQKAGKIDELPEVHADEIEENPTAAPCQTHSHTVFTKDDPMREMKTCYSGDQLTRVRFAGAKDLLKGAHSPTDRFEHISPFKPVMWHTKASLLQYSYTTLYDSGSTDQKGTLKFFREKLNRKNVTPKKVLDSYEGCEELFLSVGKGYIITAALKFFGMESLDDSPTNYEFPDNLVRAPSQAKKEYFMNALNVFTDTYVLQKNYKRGDFIKNYSFMLIFLSVLVMQMKDAAKEGDGERNYIHQKLLLVVFRSLGNYSKYAIEMFIAIAQQECFLTPRLAHEFKWSYYVNWRGGQGNNMEEDLAQEISNKIGKEIVRGMGPNKTVKSISKVCKAVNGIKEITENFEKVCGQKPSSVQHSKVSEEDDLMEIVDDLIKLAPFTHSDGRKHTSFPQILSAPQRYLNIIEHHKWLQQKKYEVYVPLQ